MKPKEELFNLNEPQEKYLNEQDVRNLVSSMLVNWNITGRVKSGYIQSKNFEIGASGWKLGSDGTMVITELTFGTLTGIIKATSGVMSAITDNSGNWDTAYTHSQIAGGNSVHVSTTENTQWDSAYTHSQIAGGDSVHVSVTENTNWDTAYTHSQDNTQAHSDYLLNDQDDSTTGKLTISGGVVTKVSIANVSNPPTDADLDSAFGVPATVGAGFIGILNDNNADTNVYLTYSDGTSWFWLEGTKAL